MNAAVARVGMTGPRVTAATPGASVSHVDVRATDGALRERLVGELRRAGFGVGPARVPGAVVVAAAGSVDEAIVACPPGWWRDGAAPVLVADTFSPEQTRRAVDMGVRVLVPTPRATGERLATAVRAAQHGEGLLPHEVLDGIVDRTPAGPEGTPLTPRQTEVLVLMAEGLGNSEIAEDLACSAHTVKNVVYELMARLQVRNRAHAVAHAVRAGLV